MENSFYDLAKVLVCDPVAPNRAATRSALYSLGCRQIEIAPTLRDFMEAHERRPPDVAMCETQVGEAELCRFIRELRQAGASYNPFTIIIVTAWATNAGLTTEISNAGADGLLLRPFPASSLDQRIRTHVLHRKPFIVTPKYVGPERRTEETRASAAASFDAPNSLKTKLEGRSDLEGAVRRFREELRTARTRLDAEKARLSTVM